MTQRLADVLETYRMYISHHGEISGGGGGERNCQVLTNETLQIVKTAYYHSELLIIGVDRENLCIGNGGKFCVDTGALGGHR